MVLRAETPPLFLARFFAPLESSDPLLEETGADASALIRVAQMLNGRIMYPYQALQRIAPYWPCTSGQAMISKQSIICVATLRCGAMLTVAPIRFKRFDLSVREPSG